MAKVWTDGTTPCSEAHLNKFSSALDDTLNLAEAHCYFPGSSGNPTAVSIAGFSTVVTRNGAGDYTVVLTANFASGEVVYQVTTSDSTGASYNAIVKSSDSTGCRVLVYNASNAASDTPYVHVSAHGKRA